MRHGLQSHLKDRHPALTSERRMDAGACGRIISSFQVGADSHTANECERGKPLRKSLVEFVEPVQYRLRELDTIRKLEPHWGDGIFLGLNWRSWASFMGTSQGVTNSTGIRRESLERRWPSEAALEVEGFPWHHNPEEEERQGWEALRLPEEARSELEGVSSQGVLQRRLS